MRIQVDHQEKNRLVLQSDARDWISASDHRQPEPLVARIEYQKVACGTVVVCHILVHLTETLNNVLCGLVFLRIEDLHVRNEPFWAFRLTAYHGTSLGTIKDIVYSKWDGLKIPHEPSIREVVVGIGVISKFQGVESKLDVSASVLVLSTPQSPC